MTYSPNSPFPRLLEAGLGTRAALWTYQAYRLRISSVRVRSHDAHPMLNPMYVPVSAPWG